MDKVTKDTIQNIHNADTQMVISVTGAGSKAITWLLSIPGASKTLLEAYVPYSESSQKKFLDASNLSKSVSEDTATALAKKSYRNAVQLRQFDYPVIGVGCTAAISTDRNRRGANEAFISIWNPGGINTIHITLDKSEEDRAKDEEKISLLILSQIAKMVLGKSEIEIPLNAKDTIEESTQEFKSIIDSLIAGQIKSFIKRSTTTKNIPDGKYSGVILSGSFNPLHQGHVALKKYVAQKYDLDFTYEISISNVDKPNLTSKEIKLRLGQFKKEDTVIIDQAPLFSEKSILFPKSIFLIGYDTAERLVDIKYYSSDFEQMCQSLSLIEHNKCRFLIAGRVTNGKFLTLENLNIPKRFKDLFIEIPESEFRVDKSSSEIRNRTPNGF